MSASFDRSGRRARDCGRSQHQKDKGIDVPLNTDYNINYLSTHTWSDILSIIENRGYQNHGRSTKRRVLIGSTLIVNCPWDACLRKRTCSDVLSILNSFKGCWKQLLNWTSLCFLNLLHRAVVEGNIPSRHLKSWSGTFWQMYISLKKWITEVDKHRGM